MVMYKMTRGEKITPIDIEKSILKFQEFLGGCCACGFLCFLRALEYGRVLAELGTACAHFIASGIDFEKAACFPR